MEERSTYEHEIDLKDLMFAVLRRWRVIIVVAIVLAVALGGYKVGSGLAKQADTEYVEQQREEYQTSLDLYESNKATLEREIQNLEDNIADQAEYQEASVLMQISPYDKGVCTADIYVRSAYQIMPGMMYQNVDYTQALLKSYLAAVKQGDVLQDVADGMGMELRYLEELVNVELDTDSDMIHLTVIYTDEKNAETIMNRLLTKVQEKQEELTGKIGEHTLEVMNETTNTTVDMTLVDTQKKVSENLTTLQTSLQDKQKELNELEEPKMSEASKRGILMSGIKFAVLGGVLGAFMMIFFVCVAFLMSDKIVSDKELKNRFGLRRLGVFEQSGRKRVFGFVDGWLDKMEGKGKPVSEDAVYAVIAANAKNFAPEAKTVLVTGTIESERLDEVAKNLNRILDGISVTASGNMNMQAETLKKLPGCDGVILVEQCGRSTNTEVQKEVETVRNVEKDLIGFILV